jgi:VIT1/CCC1 family predicted Fe2+/Mn2+ transporter
LPYHVGVRHNYFNLKLLNSLAVVKNNRYNAAKLKEITMTPKSNQDGTLALESWMEEKRSAYLYRFLAARSENHHQILFAQLAEEAEKQADMWAGEIKKAGAQVPSGYSPDLRTRLITHLIRWFGAKQIRGMLAAMKVRGMSIYLKTEPGHPMPKSVEEIGRSHKTIGSGNNLRATVFGINDGLVSNASLIMGMAGAHASNETLIVAGIAGLLAGAFSMGAGEYISVRSQREMFEYQIGLEKKELELYPAEETAELALIYHARGMSEEEANKVATMMMKDHDNALDVLSREELGINPDDLVSPYGAAFFSFISFIFGASIPLLPFLFMNHQFNLHFAIILCGIALFTVGSILSLYTGRGALKSGLRMLLIGFVAGTITYCIGHLLGVTLG